MVVVQKRSKRKPSGARYKKTVTKRLSQKGNVATLTTVGEKRVKSNRTNGGGQKNKLLSVNKINVLDASKKKHVQATIKTVVESSANRHFVRRNILTKGSVVETDIGNVRVTNRPGQEGGLNGVLVQ